MIRGSWILLALGPTFGEDGLRIEERSEYRTAPVDPDKGKSSIYTSIQEMEDFFKEELDYVEDLRAVLDKKLISGERKPFLAAYIESFQDLMGDQEESPVFVHHPVNAYTLLRHSCIGWGAVEEVVAEEQERRGGSIGKRLLRILRRRNNTFVPGEEDLDGVARGIVRLHDYYKFNLTDLVWEGAITLDGVRHKTTGYLTAWDAFKIGVKGMNGMILGSGIQIMEAALAKARQGGVTTPAFVNPVDIKVLENLIKTGRTVHDQRLDLWGDRTNSHSTNPFPFSRSLAKRKKFARAQEKKEAGIELGNPSISVEQRKYQYMEMCRGRELRPVNLTSRLYCHYSTGHHPHYLIGPLRVEIISLQPYIALIHNFILSSELEEVVRTATPRLRRSEMLGRYLNQTSNEHRVSETAWLHEGDSPALLSFTQRINNFLKFEAGFVAGSELYQVVNYGLAGQYTHHYDAVMMNKNSIQNREVFNMAAGDRMATVMGYLSDVPAGGYTVFPLAGAVARPRRGTVVLWWNMDRAGGYDLTVEHGGCPVLIGSKWITNKWIRSNAQMFKRPCPGYSTKEIRKYRNNPQQKLQKGGFYTSL